MTSWKLVCTSIALTAFSALLASQTPSGHALFEQALAKERVEGNLADAIKLYERVVTEFASDRALAGRALVQVGLCYEKLGRAEAVPAYERLVRDFADQTDAVALARERLNVLRQPGPAATVQATTAVRTLPRLDRNNDVLAVSPDGSKAVFINYDSGQNLAVYDFTTGQAMRLTKFDWSPESSWAYWAAWSPDSRRIAYVECPTRVMLRPCELRAITPAGEATVIARTDHPEFQPAAWWPDGSALVVTRQRPDRTATVGLLQIEGGSFVPLRTLSGWTGRYPPQPSVSPDGRFIAFADGSPGDIHVISRDGRIAHRITEHPGEDHEPVWSPDGRYLAFLSDRGGFAAIWAVAIRDGEPAGEPAFLKGNMEDAYRLSWTARGLTYSQAQGANDIYTVPIDPESGALTGPPRLIPYERTGNNILPEWSPDGRYLAFVSASRSEPSRRMVVLLPSGGGQAREFLSPVERLWTLRWFGNSRGLGIAGHDTNSEPTFFRLTIATGEWQTFPLPHSSQDMQWNGMYFDWNVDGSRYFYSWQDFWNPTTLTIVERDLQSDRERIVYRGTPADPVERYRGLRFGPDRRSLSFRTRGGVFVLDVESGQVRVLHDEVPGEAREFDQPSEVPTWSPDGRSLLVYRSNNRDNDVDRRILGLRLIPADGGEVRPIPLGTDLSKLLSPREGAPRPSIASMTWSPDGRRLAFDLRSSQVDIFLIENPLALAGGANASARK